MLSIVAEHEDELGRLDSVAGDGDHGAGMHRGFRSATAAADSATGGIGSVMRSAGAAFGDKAGGTSGMLWGALLEAFGDALGDTEAPRTQGVVDAVQRCADVVQQRGKANVGDKTMLDALIPFATALRSEVADGRPLAGAWTAAAAIAKDAAQRTADLLPKMGRARPLGERSIGTPDPGAVSMALCLAAASDILERDCG
jgi:dihydroxyacetone kinase